MQLWRPRWRVQQARYINPTVVMATAYAVLLRLLNNYSPQLYIVLPLRHITLSHSCSQTMLHWDNVTCASAEGPSAGGRFQCSCLLWSWQLTGTDPLTGNCCPADPWTGDGGCRITLNGGPGSALGWRGPFFESRNPAPGLWSSCIAGAVCNSQGTVTREDDGVPAVDRLFSCCCWAS